MLPAQSDCIHDEHALHYSIQQPYSMQSFNIQSNELMKWLFSRYQKSKSIFFFFHNEENFQKKSEAKKCMKTGRFPVKSSPVK